MGKSHLFFQSVPPYPVVRKNNDDDESNSHTIRFPMNVVLQTTTGAPIGEMVAISYYTILGGLSLVFDINVPLSETSMFIYVESILDDDVQLSVQSVKTLVGEYLETFSYTAQGLVVNGTMFPLSGETTISIVNPIPEFEQAAQRRLKWWGWSRVRKTSHGTNALFAASPDAYIAARMSEYGQ